MDQSSQTVRQIGAELVVRMLEMQGVTHVFAVPGAKIDDSRAGLAKPIRRGSWERR